MNKKSTFKNLKILGFSFFTGMLLAFPGAEAFAQNVKKLGTTSDSIAVVTITGIVKDEQGNPLPGASVMARSIRKGISTNTDGYFSIIVPKGSLLHISYVAMVTKEVKAESNRSMVIVLKSSDASLGEVVITGYNQTTTRRTTGSVAIVDGDELKDKPLQNIDKLLQGKVAGLAVTSISGRPGQSASIRIRGTNTITGNAEPLWVVDGVPLQKDIPSITSSQIKAGDFNTIFSGGIAGINPYDIASVTVLKDASAAAIYGSRAAGGVIVVTTKKGVAGKMQVSYSTNASLTLAPQRDNNLMNSTEKLAWEQQLWDQFSLDGFTNKGYYPTIGLVGMVRSGYGQYAGLSKAEQDAIIAKAGETSTDWFKELFKNSFSQSHYLSFSGGSDKNTYYVSTGYNNNNGLVRKTNADRYNVNSKLSLTPNKKMSIGFNLDLSYQTAKGPSTSQNLFEYAYFANPYEHPYNANGDYKADGTYFNLKKINGGGYDLLTPPNGINVFREINETSSIAKNFSSTVTADISYKFTDNFKFIGLGSYSYTDNRNENINGRYTNAAFQDRLYFDGVSSQRTYGSIAQSTSNNSSYLLRGQFQYDKKLGEKHNISALAGSEIRRQQMKNIFTKRYGYDEITGNSSMPIPPKPINSDKIDYNDLITYAAMMDALAGQSLSEEAFASFYASVDYAYNKKYITSVTARTDGSNNFGSNQQFNPAWSLGFSWNTDQEVFFESLKPIFSSLSFKVSTGYTGNVNKGVYPQLVMDYSNAFRKTYNDYYRMGNIGNAPNPNLRWEKTQDMKAAMDFGLLKERIHGLVEVYHRKSTDLVSQLRVPSTTGFNSQSFNTSETTNQGLELTLSTLNIKNKTFSWSTSVNAAYNINKLTKFTTPSGSMKTSEGQLVGYPLGSIFSGKVIGIDPETGIYKYELRPDAKITDRADLTNYNNYLFYLGTKTAPLTGGFSTSASYNNFSLSVGGNYSIGGKIVEKISPPLSSGSLNGTTTETLPTQENDLYLNHVNVSRNWANRWTPSNPITTGYPRLIDAHATPLLLSLTNPTSSTITDASMMQNVSYLRVGSVTGAYSLPANVVKRMNLQSLSFSFSVTNLFTITNYKGIDPETPGAVYPLTRSCSFGINVGL
ncbi:MAG: SusC/RagA family TonB-linked outer membrane protein [Candidatus Pedobacter colombiensis]|uniref:SusC/RagA family TonB-linked outer membrane protein n=1 Tax=Candidatus Pedobacter colombiensis TaxID=3121371 RepID=A0AAJ5W3Y0_9SPHI|nr:SusC/RagA family TonB-linked outer membrane protein [Pedobacter sp.]WEK17497.1 MAG: SusC/RagA family TonB-linked outer membrane protein [Pedobacter sp.]